jgi:hypothetical protein
MTDYQRIVDDIRSFLQASDQTFSDSLRALAAGYNEACQETNARLRRCEEFLQKGLRSEALHFAQGEPVLLDVVAALDFPERAEWEQVALGYGLPPPPHLRIDTAEALNRAYSEERPLEHLLREHRLQALSRVSLGQRLATLRKIAVLDANNPVWSEDITTLEKARVQEIRAGLDEALKQNDNGTIFALWDELERTPWLVSGTTQVINGLRDEVERRIHWRRRAALEDAARDLAEAFVVMDERRARPLRDRLNKLNAGAPLAKQDPLWRMVAPALNWLSDLDQRQTQEFGYHAALENLERAFQREVTDEELQNLYYAARKFKRGIPAALEERYRERITSHREESSRKERVILAITIVCGLLVVATFILIVMLNKQ